MSVTYLDPTGLPKVGLYHQAAVTAGGPLVFVAGQVSVDAAGETVGAGDLAAQVEQSYVNVATALAAAGAGVHQLVKLTAYFVDWAPEKMPLIAEGLARAAQRLGLPELPAPPFTGIGVAALAAPDLMVEIEAVAAVG